MEDGELISFGQGSSGRLGTGAKRRVHGKPALDEDNSIPAAAALVVRAVAVW